MKDITTAIILGDVFSFALGFILCCFCVSCGESAEPKETERFTATTEPGFGHYHSGVITDHATGMQYLVVKTGTDGICVTPLLDVGGCPRHMGK